MAMTDEELKRWGEYGRGVSASSPTIRYGTLGDDVVMLWNLFGELEKKVRDGGQP